MLLVQIAAWGSKSTVSDTNAQVSYAQLAEMATLAKTTLPDNENRCFGVVSDNTLAGLSLLLALLDAGSPAALIAPGEGLKARVPTFCNWLVQSGGSDIKPAVAQIQQTSNSIPKGRFFVATSGSTGTPKWLVHETKRLIRNANAASMRLGHTQNSRILIPVPIHHMFGLGAALIPALISGASIHLVQRGNPLEIFAAEREFDPSFAFFVPSQIRSILAMRRRPRPYSGVCVAGDKLTAEDAERCEALHGPILNLYGSSEHGVIAACDPSEPPEVRHQSAGRPLPNVTLCDAATDTGQSFTLRLRHPDACLGIAGSDGSVEAKQPKISETGDIAGLLPGGQLCIMGRKDHALKRDGLMVYLSEIESCLANAKGVREAIVVVAGQSRRGDGLVAFFTHKGRNETTTKSIRRHCIDNLPSRAVPDRFIQLDALPYLASGKADRSALAQLAKSDS